MKRIFSLFALALFFGLASVSAAFAQTTPQTSGEHFAEGNKFYQKRQWDKAITHYSESIKMREENATAFLMRGAAYVNLKQLDKALADYNQAIALDAGEYLAYYRRGEALEKQGKTELAAADKAEFKKRIGQRAKPRNATEFYEFADYFVERGFNGDGIVYYGEAIKLDASSKNGFPPVTALEKRGELYALSGKLDEAVKDYTSALAQTGETRPQINFKRANLYEELFLLENDTKLLDNAVADYSVLINNYRKNYVSDEEVLAAREKRAAIYEGNKEWDKALADYTESLKIEPQNATHFNRRAGVQVRKGEYDKAIRDYDQALALRPKSGWIYNARGQAYHKLNETEKALADFDKAIEAEPSYDQPYLNRAIIYSDRGEHDKAIANYTSVLTRYPKYTNVLHDRGVVYLYKKDWDKALVDLNLAIELAPKTANFYNTRGAIYRGQEALDKALADFTQAIALDAKHPNAYSNRASLYRKLGKTAEAQADETKAQELKAAD